MYSIWDGACARLGVELLLILDCSGNGCTYVCIIARENLANTPLSLDNQHGRRVEGTRD